MNIVEIKTSDGNIKPDDATMEIFDNICHKADDGTEYWLGRELADELDYGNYWRNFDNIVKKVKGVIDPEMPSSAVLGDVAKNENIIEFKERNSNGIHLIGNYLLTRYACWRIAMECDSRKKKVNMAKEYFAYMGRMQELNKADQEILDIFDRKIEYDEERLECRDITKIHNNWMGAYAAKFGAAFQDTHDVFYLGMYDMIAAELRGRRGIKKGTTPYEFMNPMELYVNIMAKGEIKGKLNQMPYIGRDQFLGVIYQTARKWRWESLTTYGRLPEDFRVAKLASSRLPAEIKRTLKKRREIANTNYKELTK